MANHVRMPQVGDRYYFRPFGQLDPEERFMVITGCSVSGEVQYRIGFMGELSEGLFAASLTEVLTMISHGVWSDVPPHRS